MTRRTIIIVGDDDAVLETRTNGTQVWRIYAGTAGDDHIIYEGTRADRTTIIAGSGNDWIEKTVFAGPMQAYGDNGNGEQGARNIGPRFAGGDDRIDFAWGDVVKSGAGADTYRHHGDKHGRRPADLWINMEEDTLIIPADDVRVDGFDLGPRHLNRNGTLTAEIDWVRLEFDAPGSPFADPKVRLMFTERGGEDRPTFEITYDGTTAGARDAIGDLVDAWSDGRGHDPLVF